MRLTGLKLPLERLSATSLSTFMVCPEQFRHKYILNEKEGMSGDRFMGSVTHQALAALFNPDRPADATPADLDAVVDHAWQGIIEREGEPEWHATDATESYRRAKQMVREYAPIALAITPIAVEQRFEETIAGVQVVGYVDRELSDRILEVKTASQKVSKPKSRWSFQGRLYSLVTDKPIEWHVVSRQATTKIYTANECPSLFASGFSRDATVRMVRQAVEYMNDCFARYGPDSTWPTTGIHGDWTCAYCSFRKGCPAWAHESAS